MLNWNYFSIANWKKSQKYAARAGWSRAANLSKKNAFRHLRLCQSGLTNCIGMCPSVCCMVSLCACCMAIAIAWSWSYFPVFISSAIFSLMTLSLEPFFNGIDTSLCVRNVARNDCQVNLARTGAVTGKGRIVPCRDVCL
jgi:hypothetical protein